MHWNIIDVVQIIDRANITARYVQGHHGDKKASMAGHTYDPQDKRIVRTCTLAKPKKKNIMKVICITCQQASPVAPRKQVPLSNNT